MKIARTTHRRRKAMTLVETVIAMSVMSIFFLAVAYTEITAAKQTLVLFGDARTMHRAHLVLQQIRSKVHQAEVGSLVLADSGRTLRFRNPNLPLGVTSAFVFNATDHNVLYYMDTTQPASAPGQGIGLVRDLRFEIMGAGNSVRVTVQTEQKYSWKLPRLYSLDTIVTLRN